MRVAVLNAGSGTVKAAVFEVDGAGAVERGRHSCDLPEDGHRKPVFREALRGAGATPESVDAVGHRIVHGGMRFTEPVRIDRAVEDALEALVPLAPLHNPLALEGVRVARDLLPDHPAVAVFDTAFHARRDEASLRYALPWELADELSLRRYGFHGIAHASLVESLAETEGVAVTDVDAVTLQLGAGCSACAVERGRSIETSMGFTPLEGLPMSTRSGDVDPGAVLHLLRSGRGVAEVEAILAHRSGLLGLAGSADPREVLRAEAAGDRHAAVTLDLFTRRIAATAGAYLTLLQGRGAVVFGGGIGTHSAEIRRRVVDRLAAWDTALDPGRNAGGAPGRISAPGTRPVYVFETDEESLIARASATVIEAESAGRGRRRHR